MESRAYRISALVISLAALVGLAGCDLFTDKAVTSQADAEKAARILGGGAMGSYGSAASKSVTAKATSLSDEIIAMSKASGSVSSTVSDGKGGSVVVYQDYTASSMPTSGQSVPSYYSNLKLVYSNWHVTGDNNVVYTISGDCYARFYWYSPSFGTTSSYFVFTSSDTTITGSDLSGHLDYDFSYTYTLATSVSGSSASCYYTGSVGGYKVNSIVSVAP